MEAYFDANNQLVELPGGYAMVRHTYQGELLLETTYYGADGLPMIGPYGYAIVRYAHDELGQVVQEAYFREDGTSCYSTARYAIKKIEYRDNVTVESYYTDRMELVRSSAGYAMVSRTYDDRENLLMETYYDVTGQPINRLVGYGGVQYVYDARDRVLTTTYLDFQGQPTASGKNLGYATAANEYDAGGSALNPEKAEKQLTPFLNELLWLMDKIL